VRIDGVDPAATQDYLAGHSNAALTAYRASDELHRALGDAAAELFLASLKRHANVALASGRGVGFSISSLEELAGKRPSWLKGFETVHIESLCGGGHVGTWATPVTRALDADQNAFALANLLGVSKTNVDFMGGWIASKANRRLRRSRRIDLALVGLGQLNSRHHFFYHYQEVQLGEMAEPLARIRRLQEADPRLVSSIGEVCHRLFLIGPGPFPPELVEAVDEINDATLTASPERLHSAAEVLLVAGGAQKAPALIELLGASCRDAPIDASRVTLVTDSATAVAVLDAV
jgi:DNA-binding transcriptional regulator LsrR (DeoR family)